MNPTPYDTGQRHEPILWTHVHRVKDGTTDEELDRFGKVEFEDNASTTTAIVWVQGHEDGRDVLHVELWADMNVEVTALDGDPLLSLDGVSQVGTDAELIRPGDLVVPIDRDLDSRQVVAVGIDWLTLDIFGTETQRLPLSNYRVVQKHNPAWRPMPANHRLPKEEQ